MGAVLVFVGLAGFLAVVYPPYTNPDEAHHVDYAWRVGHGELPRYVEGTSAPLGIDPQLAHYTAHHPPVFYALTAPVLTPLLDDGRWRAAVLAGRAVSVAFGALAVAGVSWATSRLRPDVDSTLVVGSAMVAAGLTPMIRFSAVFHNDSLSVLAAVLATGLTVTVLRDGPSHRRIAALTLVSLIGVGTRASFLGVLGLVVLAVAVASVFHSRSAPRWRTALAAVARVAVLTGIPTLAFGWFYARNRALTGHLTGRIPEFGQALGRGLRSPLDVAMDPKIWTWSVGGLFPQAFHRFPGHWVSQILALVGILLVVGIAVRRCVRRWRSAPPSPTGWLAIAFVALLGLGLLLELALYIADAGGANPRYLLPALVPISLVVAVGLRTPRKLRGAALLALSAVAIATILHASHRFLVDERYGAAGVWESWRRGAADTGVPAALVPALVAVALAGLACEAWSLWTLTDPPDHEVDAQPAGPSGRQVLAGAEGNGRRSSPPSVRPPATTPS